MRWFKWPRCIDCRHITLDRCLVCGGRLCFECAGGIFQLHGYSPGFVKCKACKEAMDRAARQSFPLSYPLSYQSVVTPPGKHKSINKEELTERLADAEHASWPSSQSYLFSKCEDHYDV